MKKFGFENKEVEEGDLYYNEEVRLCWTFPFLFLNVLVEYKYINGEWVEQDKLLWKSSRTKEKN